MNNNYFFFDGSALLSDIKMIRRKEPWLLERKLKLRRLVHHFATGNFLEFHGGSYRRAVFYFVEGDQRIESFIEVPEATVPGAVNDFRVEYCGMRVKSDERVTEWLQQNNAPEHVTDRLHRSEKAVDTQICCDALQLAALGKIDRLFLYTNDYDFAPLLRMLRQFGVNVNLMRLHESLSVHKLLAPEFDAFHVLGDYDFLHCFDAVPADRPKPESDGGRAEELEAGS